MQLAIHEMQTRGVKLNRVWVKDGAIAALIFSLFLGFVGPLGDYILIPLEKRLLGWTAIGMTGFCVYAGLLLVLDRFKSDWTWLTRLGLTTIFGAVLLTPLVSIIDRVVAGDESDGLLETYFTVLPIGLVYLFLFESARLFRARRSTAQTQDTPDGDLDKAPEAPMFMRHIADKLDGTLICLTKEDHYLRVYTDQGDCLIRLRMSDAVAELENLAGLQTHRSWWVADEAVVSAKKRNGGGANAILSNGLSVPISRARVTDAQAAGWFERG